MARVNPRPAIAAARKLLRRAQSRSAFPWLGLQLPPAQRRAARAAAFDAELILSLIQETLRRPYEPPAILSSVICMEEDPQP